MLDANRGRTRDERLTSRAKTLKTFQRFRALSIMALTAIFALAQADELPAPLHALQKQGVVLVGPFASTTGLKAYAALADGRPIYLTPNGRLIAGTALDEEGRESDGAALEAAVHPPLGEAAWKQLEASRWIADGNSSAPRIIYVFTDPNCPFCTKLWADARPWVDSGKVQLRHVIVGILTPTSRGKAAALLTAKNPSNALSAYEALHAPGIAKAMAAGERPRPLGDEGIQPMTSIPPHRAGQLDANARLMASFALPATPGVVWRGSKGEIHKRAGVPDTALTEVLGPR